MVNTREPDYQAYPLYAFANSSICIVGPGDGLFVPAGSPHQVCKHARVQDVRTHEMHKSKSTHVHLYGLFAPSGLPRSRTRHAFPAGSIEPHSTKSTILSVSNLRVAGHEP